MMMARLKGISKTIMAVNCAMFLLCFFAGIVGAQQFTRVREAGGSASEERITALEKEIARASSERMALEARLSEQTALVSDALIRQNEMNARADRLRNEADALATSAGLRAATGPGITVLLEPLLSGDAAVRATDADNLLMLVNELRAAGAEAVSVNGQRIGAMTEIRVAGAFININAHPTASPYAIAAIGHGETLSAALRLPGGVASVLEKTFSMKITLSDSLEIPPQAPREAVYLKPAGATP